MAETLISVDEAQRRLLAAVPLMAAERVALADAGGRVLAEDLAALRTQPPMDVSAMDGYAVRAADVVPGQPMPVTGESAAGHGHGAPLAAGAAVRIFTGAPVPDGADSVIMQERARRDGDRVTFSEAVEPGRHIRPAGTDFAAGLTGLVAGTRLGMGQIGFAAAMNHGLLPVRRRPKVAILATGDELVVPGTAAAADRIVASNSFAVAHLVRETGGEAIDLGLAPDDLAEIRARIRAGLAAGADILVLIGGASVGDHDFTKPALAAEGMELDFWRLAMRPGKPLVFGRLGAVHALGLPGNPVSSMVSALLFLAPLIRAMLGRPEPLPASEPARLGAAMKANDLRRDFVRARLAVGPDGLVATPVRSQDSSLLSMIAAADALIIRDEHAPAAEAGEPVRILRL